MTEAQIVQGFLLSLTQLIPNTRLRTMDEEESLGHGSAGTSGFQVDPAGNAVLWFTYPQNVRPLYFSVERPGIGLTSNELAILELIPPSIEELRLGGSLSFMGLSLKFSSKLGFGDVLMAKFLDTTDSLAINNRLSIFLALQDLSFRYYEDKRCSSGFYYTAEPQAFKTRVADTNFRFYPFEEPMPFHYEIFSSPASFRYVDGRNSYYVIDHQLMLHGILRMKNPDQFSLVARLRNLHVKSLLVDMPGKPWVAFVGLKEEVYVLIKPELQIKWSKNHWQLRDRTLIFTLLARFGLKEDLQPLLVSLLFALSEGGYGASILIPEDEDKLPPAIGKIDHTDIGSHLRRMIQRSSIVELDSTNSLLGIIASDGLTSISREGLILSCGDIIDISRAALLQSQGGGRSQAAIAASFHGLSIKISQNGPLSFYWQGQLLLQF